MAKGYIEIRPTSEKYQISVYTVHQQLHHLYHDINVNTDMKWQKN